MSNTRFRCAQCKLYAEQSSLFRQAGLARLCSTACYSAWLDEQRKKRQRNVKKQKAQTIKTRKAAAPKVPGEVRFNVRERDVCCRWCGKTGTQVHHVRYRSEGGPDTQDNLILLCGRCHERAHSSKDAYQPVLLTYLWMVETGQRKLMIPQIVDALDRAGLLTDLQRQRFGLEWAA